MNIVIEYFTSLHPLQQVATIWVISGVLSMYYWERKFLKLDDLAIGFFLGPIVFFVGMHLYLDGPKNK